ncbi:MAG: DNA methyltransferase [Patescibacteria group bacterium]|jgi:tRNA G10  N-methylase Trm11
MQHNNQKYAFVLGRERDLCLTELYAVLVRFGFCFTVPSVYDNVAIINIENANESDVASLIESLGGTMKIFRMIVPVDKQVKDRIISYITSSERSQKKFNYTISSYSRLFNYKSIFDLGLSIKKELKKELSLRFVEIREGKDASSILSLKNHFVDQGFEFGLFEADLGILIALTDAEEWGERDYDKPSGDKRSGMLPPKLARMMINLALGSKKQEGKSLVIDPFCGSGNILIEALLLGADAMGSDVSEKAVNDSMNNIKWLVENPKYRDKITAKNPKPKVHIDQADASNVDFAKLLSTFDFRLSDYNSVAVVAEPFLGEPKKFKPSLNAVKGEYAKIQELYIDFLKNIRQSGLPINSLVLIFPLVETLEGKLYSLFDASVDEIEKIGYSVLTKPLVYGREYQVVKREIVLLQF